MMGNKLQKNIFFNINKLNEKIVDLQTQIIELNAKVEKYQEIERCHLLRVKNGETLSDDYILNGRAYNDLSPEAALNFYQQNDTHFILIDVSQKGFQTKNEFEEAINIPFDELNFRYKEITNKSTPILIISEDGVQSILACEFLNQMGFYNVNNISGGHKYWPAQESKPNHLKSVA